jgi:hypothetical protein
MGAGATMSRIPRSKLCFIPWAGDEPAIPYRLTARHVADLMLAGDAETLHEDLALVAVDVIEQRDAAIDVMRAAVTFARKQNEALDLVRRDNYALRDEIRRLLAIQRAA